MNRITKCSIVVVFIGILTYGLQFAGLVSADAGGATEKSRQVVGAYRDIIILLSDFDRLDPKDQQKRLSAARKACDRKDRLIRELSLELTQEIQDVGSNQKTGASAVQEFLAYAGGKDLFDADRLSFLDLADDLDASINEIPEGAGGKLTALKSSVTQLKATIDSAQKAYSKEIAVIFSRLKPRGEERQKWGDYLAAIRRTRDVNKILADYPLESWEKVKERGKRENEIFGYQFPPKSVYLTFDDGPHPRYTARILDILKTYGIKAGFYEVGENLGKVNAQGEVTLYPGAAIAQRILQEGHHIANHSYSHPFLPKLSQERQQSEMESTNALLTKILGSEPFFFRPPYGAENSSVVTEAEKLHLKSVLWNIDSLDWSDPIPESIAQRVFNQVNAEKRGIILFHDIHGQSVKALPIVLAELVKQNYTFLTYESGNFVAPPAPQTQTQSK